MRLVLVESPFAGRGAESDSTRDADQNIQYVRAVCRYLSLRGDAPYASHIFCTQFLEDSDPTERQIGIEIGLQWGAKAALTVVAIDRGISVGMRYGIDRARKEGRPVEWLSLKEWRDSWLPTGVERPDLYVVSAAHNDALTITHGGRT